MEMTQKIVDSLNAMGLCLNKLSDLGYYFVYGSYQYVYMISENNDEIIRISVPHLFEVTDDTRLYVYEAMNATAQVFNYVKPMMIDDSVWISYEHRQVGTSNLEEMLKFMLRTLMTAASFFHTAISFISDDEEQENQEPIGYSNTSYKS